MTWLIGCDPSIRDIWIAIDPFATTQGTRLLHDIDQYWQLALVVGNLDNLVNVEVRLQLTRTHVAL
jgi:hypothetical protein